MNYKRFLIMLMLFLSLVLVACEETTYTIKFDVDGELYYTLEIDNTNSTKVLVLPEAPTKDGDVFEGWFLDKDIWEQPFDDNYLLENTITESITVYAKWESDNVEITTFTITFNVEGELTTVLVIEGGLVVKPENPVKEGYIFVIWMNGEEAFDFNTPITADITLVALFKEPEVCTVTFNSNGGSVIETVSSKEGSPINNIPVPYKDSFMFLGWYSDSDLNNEVSFPYTITENVTLFAKWESIDNIFSLFLNDNSYSIVGLKDKTLENLYLPKSYNNKPITSIGDGAFRDCSSLTSIVIPNSVTSIGYAVFAGCSSLTDIIVDKNNQNYKSIDGVLFNKDGSLLITYPTGKEAISYSIPNTVTSIGNSAFIGCSSLTSVVIPNSVTSIGFDAFCRCTSLTSVTFEEGSSLTSIGDGAFSGCTSLTSIVIPNSVTSIRNYAFQNCSSLTIYAEVSSKPSGWDSYWNFSDCPVYWAGEWHYDESGKPVAN